MNLTLKHLGISALACAGLLIGTTSHADAKAAWESHAGGERNDAARGGMVQTSDGGFVSVGESESFGNGDYDVYVVKVDICGNFQWAATYDLGGNDHARRVRFDPIDKTLIITGETENANNCCTHDDAFLMKLNEDGGVMWAKTYGGRGVDRGNDVTLYYKGEKGYLIGGGTTSFGAGGDDGWIIATDRDGNLQWSRVYGGERDEELKGIIQASNEDIVATGYTNSYTVNADNDIWILRTNKDGLLSGGTNWSLHYGIKTEDVANAIVEAPTGNDLGPDVVVAGYSLSFTPKAEAYLLRVDVNGNYVADHIYGGGSVDGLDQFRDVAVVDDGSGDFYAVGGIYKPNTGYGGYDVFDVRVDKTLSMGTPTTWARNRGSEQDDEAYGLALDNQQEHGHGFAGYSLGFTFGVEDMYMGLAFSFGDDFCHDNKPDLADYIPAFKPDKAPTCTPLVNVQCDVKTEPKYNDWYKIICSTCLFKTNGNGNENLGMAAPLANPSGVTMRTFVTNAANK